MMGNLSCPRFKCYWDPKFRVSQIADTMPFNRLLKLGSNIHWVNVTGQPDGNDRSWKVRPLYNSIRERLLCLPIEESHSVDEQMVPFKGTLDVKKYGEGKPNPWGIKVSTICGTSGQMYEFIIYRGLTTELDPRKLKTFGQVASVVM
ncbi:hypothetical protein JTB14_036581 [Gonioctena quinquepunctata]|nr:hypothetical protein JTB14_036581 [Gonioctena quinquepunctata]